MSGPKPTTESLNTGVCSGVGVGVAVGVGVSVGVGVAVAVGVGVGVGVGPPAEKPVDWIPKTINQMTRKYFIVRSPESK